MTDRHAGKSLRRRTAEILEPAGFGDKTSRVVDLLLMILIVLNVIDVTLESIGNFHLHYQRLMWGFEVFSIAVFSLEYALRLWSCVDVGQSVQRANWRMRLRYFFSPLAIVDLLAILPFYLGFFFTLDLRFLRAVRILRIFKLTRYSTAMQMIFNVFVEERRAFVAAFSILFTLLILAASGIHAIEQDIQPDKFGSIPEAMWWAMATLTTVGYGDVTPVTPWGKFFGGLITIIGMGMVALPAGILASGFSTQMQRRQQKFKIMLKDVLRDGIVTDDEWEYLEALRAELDLDKEEADLLIQLAETKKIAISACPHCGEKLYPRRRATDD